MLGAPTYQLRDLGQMSPPPALSLLTSEMRTQRKLAGRALGPSAPSTKARSRCCPWERPPHPVPAPGGQQPMATAANTSSRHPPAALPADATLHDSPGPAQVTLSVGFGARESGSPRGLLISGPPSPPSSQQPPDCPQTPIAAQCQAAETWLPAGAASRGGTGPALSFREVSARLWRRCHRAWPETCRNDAESDCPLSCPG